MILFYLDGYYDGTYFYNHLIINNSDGTQYMRLCGVVFSNIPTNQELINRAFEILNNIDATLIIEKIYLNENGSTCIYELG
jgi:hypothetical protein